MRNFPLVSILAMLAAPPAALGHPHEGSPELDLAMALFPAGEHLQEWAGKPAKGAMLGISLGGWADGAVEGLNVMSVSPGGPADKAGLKSGDKLTTLNGQELAAESGQKSYETLRALLAEIEPGSEIAVRYQRGEEQSEAMIVTGAWPQVLAQRDGGDWRQGIVKRAEEWANLAKNWSGGDVDVRVEVKGDGENPRREVRVRRNPSRALDFTDMAGRLTGLEITELTPGLGDYFGTDHGLLVVRAPDDNDVALEAGDVIRKIGGRDFKDARHATRILRSYEPGEQVELQVLRHKRKKVVSFELPEGVGLERMNRRRGRFVAPEVPEAPAAPEQGAAEST